MLWNALKIWYKSGFIILKIWPNFVTFYVKGVLSIIVGAIVERWVWFVLKDLFSFSFQDIENITQKMVFLFEKIDPTVRCFV